jgi:hypothetical protein
MFTRYRIRRHIKRWLRTNSFGWVRYAKWYVGITNNPNLRLSQHKTGKWRKPRFFKAWDAASLLNARTIEKHFGQLGKGMAGGKVLGNVRKTTRWIYVYKK